MKKKSELPDCPVALTVSLIGSKWKLLIVRNLMERPYRFNELQYSLEGISHKVLRETLRSMELDGIVVRKEIPGSVRHVEYSLSEVGQKMLPVIESMREFGQWYQNGGCAQKGA